MNVRLVPFILFSSLKIVWNEHRESYNVTPGVTTRVKSAG